jgi:5-methylcytosine-specific restriction protein A
MNKLAEQYGYSGQVDADGWPADKRHPANAGFRSFGYSIPDNLKPSRVPVVIVCGPPASGKSTWVKRNAARGDTIIDLDESRVAVGGRAWDSDGEVLQRALAHRNELLHSLADKKSGRAFVIIGAPTINERVAWRRALGQVERVVVLDVPAETCIARLNRDPARAHARLELARAARRWHKLKTGTDYY